MQTEKSACILAIVAKAFPEWSCFWFMFYACQPFGETPLSVINLASLQTKFWPQLCLRRCPDPSFQWARGAHVKELMASTNLQAAHLWWHTYIWLWVSIHFMSRPQFYFNEAAGRACVKSLVWNMTTINWEKEFMLDHAKGQELLVRSIILEEEHLNWGRGLDHSDEKARREEQSLLTFDLEWP